jgi:hypothetical protein
MISQPIKYQQNDDNDIPTDEMANITANNEIPDNKISTISLSSFCYNSKGWNITIIIVLEFHRL